MTLGTPTTPTPLLEFQSPKALVLHVKPGVSAAFAKQVNLTKAVPCGAKNAVPTCSCPLLESVPEGIGGGADPDPEPEPELPKELPI